MAATAHAYHTKRFYAKSFKGSRARIFLVLVLTGITLLFASCFGDGADHVKLPESPELHGTPQWGVIIGPTARLYAEPDRGAAIVEVLRRGDMVMLQQRKAGDSQGLDKKGLWYHLDAQAQSEALSGLAGTGLNQAAIDSSGWLEGSVMELYAFELQARERNWELKQEILKHGGAE